MGHLGFHELVATVAPPWQPRTVVPVGLRLAGGVGGAFPGRRRRLGEGLGRGGSGAAYGVNFGSFGARVDRLEIPEGEAGTVATLEKMREAVLGPEGAHNAEVRLLAQKAVSDVQSKDYVGEARAIFDFMQVRNGHVRYTLDPRGLEWVQTPWFTTLVVGQGDCDDHATAACALATSLGHGCGFRTVKGDRQRPNEWSHVYAVIGVRQNGKVLWLPVDSTEYGVGFGQDPPGSERMEKKTWVVVPA